MSTPLLVVTSDIPFGELIRQTLEETGRFVIRVTGEREAATACSQDFKPALAFLDTALSEPDLLKVGALLREINPDVIFVVISEAGWHSALEELFPRDYLSKPFYLPDLLDMMDKFFPASSTKKSTLLANKSNSADDLPWLSDVNRAAQHLTRLTLESSAQAALITRADQLWAYAGQLPQPAASELAETLSRYWDHQEENDLVRFVRLTSTNAEHMLYGTQLAEDMVLALVFDAETPFSTIRTQASQLVHSLSTSPSEESQDDDGSGEGLDLNPVSDEFPDIPPSKSPTSHPVDSEYTLKPAVSGSRKKSTPAIARPTDSPFNVKRESSPVERFKLLVETDQSEIPAPSVERTDQSHAPTRKIKTRKPEPLPETYDETLPHSIADVARKIVLEPVTAAVYNLDYACLLVPRFPQHHMTGDFLDKIGDWVSHICIAFGWRLEYISVRPDYLQWIVNVPPVTSPGYLMRILRQHTSMKIFTEFPRYKKENPSGDFWAPGYLIMGGSQPPPAQLIKDYIAQTRQRQGIIQQINH